MDRVIGLIIQFVGLLLALVIPGGLVLLVASWVLRLWRMKPPALPLLREEGGLYTLADWRRDAREAHPIRWWLTETMPGALARARDFFRAWWSGPEDEEFTPQQEVLHGAFEGLVRWVEEHPEEFGKHTYVPGSLEERRVERLGEINELYEWWTVERERAFDLMEELDEDEREFWEDQQEELDQLALARLANVWRDLT